MKVLDESGLVRLKDWTKFAHPISITLGNKISTQEYSIPADQQKLIFTSKGDAGNGYFPQYIILNGVQDTIGPINAKYFSSIIFNLQTTSITGTTLLYSSLYHNTSNDNVYVISAKVLRPSESDAKVRFMIHGKLGNVL